MASSSGTLGTRTHDLPAGSVEYYRYLEQDERMLAALSITELAKEAHLRFANHYHELAQRAAQEGQ